MTLLEEPLVLADDDELDAGDGSAVASDGPPTDTPSTPTGGDGGARPSFVAGSAALACLSAAWMVTRLFRGAVLPLATAAAAVALGAGLTWLGHRRRLPLLRHAVLPAAAVLGAIVSTAGGGAGSVPSLVADAVRGGGLREAPIPFDPGWRFLVVLVFALFSAGATALGIGLGRPKLALAVPVPIALGAALVQPKGSELAASAVGMLLLIGAMAVSYGADLSADGVVGSGFELRRMARGVVLLVVILAGSVGLAQVGFLFPDTAKDEVIPPMKPPTPPPLPDRELFTVRSEAIGPWRVGVLDVYQDDAFLLPSVDPARMRKVPRTGELEPVTGDTYEAEVRITALTGQTLVSAPNAARVSGIDGALRFDPRTQLVKLVDTSAPRGLRYTMQAPVLPTSKQLADAPEPRQDLLDEMTALPPAPAGVSALLGRADQETRNRFDRLQLVRQALYANVVAAGGGKPVDVPPARVDAMLDGAEATPYEITAAEVMLARWAGIPARVGYGFYGGDRTGDVTSFRPLHGAAWLEAYFEGHGWIPVIGTPPKAKSSLSNDQKKKDPRIVPTDELAVSMYVPVRRTATPLLYRAVRFYAQRVVPLTALVLLVVWAYPALRKLLRSVRRRRWAVQHGGLARIAVAYAELRDRCHDLNIGDVRRTPLRFRAAVDDDAEHEELAWLVTRATWGDLARDLRAEDVEAAEAMARSVQRRIEREQPGLMRVLAWTSRASLRDPWTLEVPNVRGAGWLPRTRVGRVATAAVAFVVLVAGIVGIQTIGDDGGAPAASEVRFPDPLLPPTVLGVHRVERRPDIEAEYGKRLGSSLVAGARVYTVRTDEVIQGSVQVGVFRPGVDATDERLRSGIEGDLGPATAFRTVHLGTIRLRVLDTPEERITLWFNPDANAMELFVMRRRFEDADAVVKALVLRQRVDPPGSPEAPDATVPPPAGEPS